MAFYITVDGGTTNTRVSLIKDGECVGTKKYPIGARAGIDGTDAQKGVIREAITELLSAATLDECDVTCILASGMITSEHGLINLPHIQTPAGVNELHAAMHECMLEDISKIPFVFIRGVKSVSSELSEYDVMRGEETELIGLAPKAECVYILPGSHSKIIYTDESARIKSFYTMLSGEMIAALSSGTILKDAVDLSVAETDEDFLMRGYNYATKEGLGEALFKVRILKNFFSATPVELYSFFVGAVLSGEIKKILSLNPKSIIIGGKAQLKNALCIMLSNLSDTEIITVSSEDADASVWRGAIKVYEHSAE